MGHATGQNKANHQVQSKGNSTCQREQNITHTHGKDVIPKRNNGTLSTTLLYIMVSLSTPCEVLGGPSKACHTVHLYVFAERSSKASEHPLVMICHDEPLRLTQSGIKPGRRQFSSRTLALTFNYPKSVKHMLPIHCIFPVVTDFHRSEAPSTPHRFHPLPGSNRFAFFFRYGSHLDSNEHFNLSTPRSGRGQHCQVAILSADNLTLGQFWAIPY